MDQGQPPGKGSQIQRLFHSAVCAAHHIDVFSGVARTVPGGVQSDAPAGQLLLAGNAQFAGRAAARQNHPRRLIDAFVGAKGLDFSLKRHLGHGFKGDVHPCAQSLFLHTRGEAGSGLPGQQGGVVRDGGHVADQAAHLGFFQNQYFFPRLAA